MKDAEKRLIQAALGGDLSEVKRAARALALQSIPAKVRRQLKVAMRKAMKAEHRLEVLSGQAQVESVWDGPDGLQAALRSELLQEVKNWND